MKKPNKMPICILIILLILSLTCGNAQEPPRDSILLRPDGSVTFQYNDTTAKSVKVYCDCKLRKETQTIRRENYHSAKMSKVFRILDLHHAAAAFGGLHLPVRERHPPFPGSHQPGLHPCEPQEDERVHR